MEIEQVRVSIVTRRGHVTWSKTKIYH